MPTDTHTDAKGATPPKLSPVRKPRLDEEDDAPAVVAVQKQKVLPTGLSRAIVLAAFIFTVGFVGVELARDRYAISPVPNSANSFVYRIDRLTGSIHFCGAQQCSVVHVRGAE